MFYALTGDGLSDRELSDYAELVKREVNELEGVDRVELYGKRSECINISLLQDRMANLGVKPDRSSRHTERTEQNHLYRIL